MTHWNKGPGDGPNWDIDGLMHGQADLAESLMDQSITAMKIWLLDPYAPECRGYDISASAM